MSGGANVNASEWIGLASVSGFVLLQTSLIAFALGGLFQRVRALEGRPVDGDCRAELGVLNATLGALKDTIERVERHFTDRFKEFGDELSHVRNSAAMAKEMASSRRRASEGRADQ